MFDILKTFMFDNPQFIVAPVLVFIGRKYLFRHGLSRDFLATFAVAGALAVSLMSFPAAACWVAFLLGINMKGMRGATERRRRGFMMLCAASVVGSIAVFKFMSLEASYVVAVQSVVSLVVVLLAGRKAKHEAGEIRTYTGKIRADVFARDGYKCSVRGCKASKDEMEIDHIKAWKRGGRTTLENAQVLCRSHNASKGAKSELEWKMTKKF